MKVLLFFENTLKDFKRYFLYLVFFVSVVLSIYANYFILQLITQQNRFLSLPTVLKFAAPFVGVQPEPSPSGSSATLVPCETDADPFPPSPDPVPYADTNPQIIVTGYMGASMAAEGYVSLGGTRMTIAGNPTSPAILPNLGLANLIADQYRFCGEWHSPFWASYFEPQLGNEQAVWFIAATTDDEWGNNGGAPAILPRLEAVIARIRSYTDAPIYASSPPPMSSFPACKTLLPEASAATQAAIDTLVTNGTLAGSPVLPDLTAEQKLNRCHPNEVGKQLWGQALLDFFGSGSGTPPTPTTPPSQPTPTRTPTPVPPTPTRTPTPVPPTPTRTPTPTTPPGIPTPTPTGFVATATPTNVPGQAGCRVTAAFWTAGGKIRQGTRVTLTALASSECNGKYLYFRVWENDGLGLIGADPVSIDPSPAIVVNGAAITTWIAEWQSDGAFKLGGNPEYFFTVQSADSPDTVSSRSPDLTVAR